MDGTCSSIFICWCGNNLGELLVSNSNVSRCRKIGGELWSDIMVVMGVCFFVHG